MVAGEFLYLGIDVKTNDYIVVIRRKDNKEQLPIWIGNSEAFAIALSAAGLKPPRPMTHDLLSDIITALGARVSRVIISGVKENTFYALVHLERGENETYIVDARPSDSIALALRTKSEILLSEDIQTFNLETPSNDAEKELASRIRAIDPQEMIGY